MSNPTANMPRGIDVSKHQRTVNWSRVAEAGIRFAYARAIDDAAPGNRRDPFFDANYAGMSAAGILRGAYYFFRPQRDVAAAANLFVSIVGQVRPGDLPPVIDVEALPNLPAARMLDGIARWMDIVEGAFGRQVMIYTNPDTWVNRLQNSRRFSDHPLWIASLREVPRVPSAFPTFTVHQHSFTGRVPGITGNVDLDRFNGSMDRLRAFAGLTPAGPLGLVASEDSAADDIVTPLLVSSVRAAAGQPSAANSPSTATGGGGAAKKQRGRKEAAKKSAKTAAKKSAKKAAKKATKKAAKKATKKSTKKAAVKRGQPASKGSSKKAAKRSSKKSR